MLLPRGLNLVYDEWGGEKASGCLLHAKFIDTFTQKAQEELARKQHYANSHEYRAYQEGMAASPDFWCKWRKSKRQPPVPADARPSTPVVTTFTTLDGGLPSGFSGMPSRRYGPKRN